MYRNGVAYEKDFICYPWPDGGWGYERGQADYGEYGKDGCD